MNYLFYSTKYPKTTKLFFEWIRDNNSDIHSDLYFLEFFNEKYRKLSCLNFIYFDLWNFYIYFDGTVSELLCDSLSLGMGGNVGVEIDVKHKKSEDFNILFDVLELFINNKIYE